LKIILYILFSLVKFIFARVASCHARNRQHVLVSKPELTIIASMKTLYRQYAYIHLSPYIATRLYERNGGSSWYFL